ncbi:MAG: 7-cyano-7-deazaguanine synthase [Acidobacteria bacterium]|nr:7-cyano-7-deazaguanine synthase [Acidobacteriota bacterium]
MTHLPNIVKPLPDSRLRVAVLSSGGLDSGVMLAELARTHLEVFPIYVSCGLYWEEPEQEFLQRFVSKLENPRVSSIQVLKFLMSDLYASQWYLSGNNIPGYHHSDAEWYIPGRNLILLSKTAVWCKLNGVNRMALGCLSGNPFPDATPAFFSSLEATLQYALDMPLKILRPLAHLHKADVISKGKELPLELTLSCAQPSGGLHCGVCGKCRERIEAFVASGVPDPTCYASVSGRK